MDSEKIENRKILYKNQGEKNPDSCRNRRLNLTVELRKKKIEETLSKRRHILESDPGEAEETDYGSLCENLQNLVRTADQNPEEQFQAVKNIRRLLCSNKNEEKLIDTVLGCGVLPILVTCLSRFDNSELQFEATWALTNIASGNSEQTYKVVEAGAIQPLFRLSTSPNSNIAEQAIWTLGNILGDNAYLRDQLIGLGFVPLLLQLIRPDTALPILRNVAWCLVNIARHNKEPASLWTIRDILTAFVTLLQHSDIQVISDSLWTLAYICDSGEGYIQLVIDAGIVPIVVPLMGHSDQKIVSAAMRTVGNIATSTDQHTQTVMDCNALFYIHDLISSPKEKIQKEALWFLSNVLAGPVPHIQAIYQKGLVPKIVECLQKGVFIIQKEAAWAVCNVATMGTVQQIERLVFEGVIPPICDLLNCNDSEIICLLLNTLKLILQKLEIHKEFITMLVEECGGLSNIENLQNHQNGDVYKAAFELLDTYFESVDEVGNVDICDNHYEFSGKFTTPSNNFEF